jgi:hypothetical protein
MDRLTAITLVITAVTRLVRAAISQPISVVATAITVVTIIPARVAVKAVEEAAIEAWPLASVDLLPRRFFRFIPVWAAYQFGIASKHHFSFCIPRAPSISKSSPSPLGQPPL